ncbi:hypothetical protein Tco_1062529 [Tanacetum coccineum]
MGRGKGSMEDKVDVSPKKITNPKNKTAKETHATEEPATPIKATASSKKKLTKRKLVLKDKTDMSEEEVEHRPLSRKKRVPKTVVIQEPPSVPVKQTYESSRKHKGIEMLFDASLLEIDTLKAQNASRRESRLQHHAGGSSEGTSSKPGVPNELTGKFAISDEGAGIQSEVPDETKNLSESDDNSDKWGSRDEENESEDDDDEKVETDDDRDDEEEEDDRSTDIEQTDTERIESDDENIKEKRFSKMEQFVKQHKETDFSTVIHDSIKSQVQSSVEKYLGLSLPNVFRKELLANNAELKKELSELNYKEIIKESMKSHVVTEFLPKAVFDFAKPMLQEEIAKYLISLTQSSSSHQSAIEAAKSLSELELKQILYDKILKISSSCSHKTHEELLNALTWSIKLDESRSKQSTQLDPIPKK